MMALELDKKTVEAQEKDSDDEDDDDDAQSVASNSSSTSTSSTGSKKKKKKKKKKSSVDGTAANQEPSSSTASTSKPKVDGKEGEKRLQAAIEVARKGDDLWIDVSNSSMQLAKTRKLLDALKSNDSVTSVNLSNCSISDEGVQAIAAVLGVNGAMALIDLDLRDNPLTDAGLSALEGLKKLRKKLMVRTGASYVEPPPEPPSPPHKGGAAGVGGAGRGSGTPDISKGKMFKRFFQTGGDDDDDDDEAGSGMSRQESQLDDRGIDPDELWDTIKELLHSSPPAIPELSTRLGQLLVLLDRETKAVLSPHNNALDGSKPHIKGCISHGLGALRGCLAAVPRRVTVQYSAETQPAVGSHRVCAAEAVALLLGPNNTSLAKAVASAKLVPAIMHLALSHPLCSSLHARTLRILCSCLQSPSVPELCMPMLVQPGWGCSLTETPQMLSGLGISNAAAAAAATKEDDDKEGEEGEEREGRNVTAGPGEGREGGEVPTVCRPLPDLLAAAATSAIGVSSGSRSRAVGFVLAACRALLEVSEQPSGGTVAGKHHEAAKALLVSNVWSEFSSEDSVGALRHLLNEQDDEFCGPKPERPPPEETPEEGSLAAMAGSLGGGLMSGREILALLQGMNMGGGGMMG